MSPATTTTQAIAIKDDGPEALIQTYRASFETVLPSHIKPDTWVRLSQGLLRRDEKLAAAARANPRSFLVALLDCARLGLEPGDTYHLVPFGREITGIVDYKGEVELAYRAGGVERIVAKIVYANDVFEFDEGQDDRPTHKPAGGQWFKQPRGEMVGAYGYAVWKDGGTSNVVVMDKAEIMEHRAMSKAKQNWDKWPKAFWRKTIVHELRKWIPTSPEFRDQMARSSTAAETVAAEVAPETPLPRADGPTDDDIAEPEPFCPDCSTVMDGDFCPKCDDR